MRLVFRLIGVLALLMGLLWIGQGLGVVRWPASSFMVDQRIWAIWGSLLALAGLALVLVGGRGRRR